MPGRRGSSSARGGRGESGAARQQAEEVEEVVIGSPKKFRRLSGILTEIDFARLSSTPFIHIMRTMEDTRAEFRTRPARAGPRGSFGTLLDPD